MADSTVSAASNDTPLFSSNLISPEVSAKLPTGYTFRALRRTDYNNSFLTTLQVLTTVGDISASAWNDRYDYMAKHNDTYYILVVCDGEGRIVGTGALIVERKFIHGLGMVGHVEDIAVAKDQQGRKLGLRVLEALGFVAKEVGCYKVSSAPELIIVLSAAYSSLGELLPTSSSSVIRLEH